MVSDNKHTELAHYSNSLALDKAEAEIILRTIWPDAPKEEVFKAALICKQYGLNPLMKHLYLVPYKNKETGGLDWSIQIGIGATRMIARRSGAYSYEDDTPRIMTEAEQMKIFGKTNPDKIMAITKVRAKDGSYAQGYGNWPKTSYVKGTDKGNTPENMAMIRSERAAIDKLFPEKLPAGVDVVDQGYEDTPKVNTLTGEIIKGDKEPPNQIAPVVSQQAIHVVSTHVGPSSSNDASLGKAPPEGKTGQVKLSQEDVDRVSRALAAAGWLPEKRQELYEGKWFKTNFPGFTAIPDMNKFDAERLIRALELAVNPKQAKAPQQGKIMEVDSGEAF